MSKMKLGQTAKHTRSGFEGIVTALSQYLTGCDRVEITPFGLDKDGRPKTSEWFDESEIEGGVFEKPGGPRDAPDKKGNPK